MAVIFGMRFFSLNSSKYTIDPAEAKQLEENNQSAFPDVDYAVVEYPLELLSKGIEIIDSPGLNDTEARNELSLGYLIDRYPDWVCARSRSTRFSM